MLTAEVFFDLPWPACFAAHERALTTWRALPVRIAWVPWEADPAVPAAGRPRRPDERDLPPGLAREFAELRLPFRASARWPNTNLALRSLLWCAVRGERAAEDARDGAFRRLFERGLDNHLDAPDVFAGLVERAGLDPIAYLADIRAGALAAELAANGARARALGLREPPALVVGGRSVPVGTLGLDAAIRELAAQ